jgi:hypothetical protein
MLLYTLSFTTGSVSTARGRTGRAAVLIAIAVSVPRIVRGGIRVRPVLISLVVNALVAGVGESFSTTFRKSDFLEVGESMKTVKFYVK